MQFHTDFCIIDYGLFPGIRGTFQHPRQVHMHNIFIVEDHPAIRTGYRKLINRKPDLAVCGEAASGQQALEMISDARPDIVLLDVFMPGMNGLEVLERLRAFYPSLPVLVISGNDSGSHADLALQLGATRYMSKSRVAEALTDAIYSILNALS